MSRMYSSRKGKSGSKKPIDKKLPSWVRYKSKEVEMIITKLAKEGKSPSYIGLVLRDTYGIPLVKTVLGKTLSAFLAEKNLLKEIPEDVAALIKKSIQLRKHMEKNNKDMAAKRGLLLTESKIKRLVKYYKRVGRLSEDWKYEPDKVKMYAE